MIRKSISYLVMAAGLVPVTALAAPKTDKQSANKVQVNPKTTPKVDKKVVLPKVDPPKDDKKVVLPKIEPKIDKKVVLPKIDPPKDDKPLVLKDKPVIVEPKGKLAGLPGLKLAGDAKVNPADLAKLKPILDAKKLKPGDLGKMKPPADFQVKPILLDKLKIPDNAPVVDKLNADLVLKDKFVVNKGFYKGGDYHLKFGKKIGTSFCYPGIFHNHWHHCIWDPWYGCNYYYCPSACCYYYWSPVDICYYPCWWFVDYGSCYYPWWLCDDFGMHIHGSGFNLHIGF